MNRATLALGATLLLGMAACDKPQPERVPPPAVTPNADADIHVKTPRGVDIEVDVDPAPGKPAVNVEVERTNDPNAAD